MLDLSLSEIACVAVVALFVIRPDDLPTLARKIRGLLHRWQNWRQHLQAEMAIMLDEPPHQHTTHTPHTHIIIGDDGQPYEAYDMGVITPEPLQEPTSASSSTQKAP